MSSAGSLWLQNAFSGMKPPKKFSVVGAENQGGRVLCCLLVRLLAAAAAGIRRRSFGCFQRAPKQTRSALLMGRKTRASAHSITRSTVLLKMA